MTESRSCHQCTHVLHPGPNVYCYLGGTVTPAPKAMTCNSFVQLVLVKRGEGEAKTKTKPRG